MSWSDTDQKYMREALSLARQAADNGEIPVGAVVVSGGEIVGRGMNTSIADSDPAGHAEIVALRDAGRSAGNYRLPGATLYVTLEPCVMCVGAMLHARVGRLVFGAYDEKAGAAGSVFDLAEDRKNLHRMEVNGGLQRDACVEILQEFFASKRGDRAL